MRAVPGDIYCEPCASAIERETWADRDSLESHLRVRRYLSGELVGVYPLDPRTVDGLAEVDAEWADTQLAAGRDFAIVVDDPAGNMGLTVMIVGDPDADEGNEW
jgi:hypothetical protein